jgi:pimeloyl-ACP methyl ester carboxylesterase
MGGNLAAHVASASPERVTDLILVDAAVYSDRIDTVRCYLAPGFGRPLLVAARLASGFLGIFSQVMQEHRSGGVWRPWLRRCRYFYHHNASEAMTQQLQCLVESPFDPEMLSPQINVLVCHGEKDTVVPVSMAREAADAIRVHRAGKSAGRTDLLVYSRSNHVPMDVEPVRFVRDVRQFLGGKG